MILNRQKIQDFSPFKSVVASSPSSLEEIVKLCLACNTRKADSDKEDIDRRCCTCNAIPFFSVKSILEDKKNLCCDCTSSQTLRVR